MLRDERRFRHPCFARAMSMTPSPSDPAAEVTLGRRDLLASLGASLVLTGPVLRTAVASTPSALAAPPEPVWGNAYGVAVTPRSAWVPARAPIVGGIDVEPSVSVLLMHHSETSNTYAIEDVPKVLRSFRSYHMSGKKRWPDVAYNFFVDRYGGIWEGRTGSIASPVVGSATGGNQGSSQLVCLVGNHHSVPPSEAARASLALLLAAMADRYALAMEPEGTTEFRSRGSTRWPDGEPIRTRTIEGHRAMSITSCPGDAAFRLLPGIRGEVHRLRVAAAAASTH